VAAKYAWMTDVHLNFINELELASLVKRINLSEVDGVLIGGDIAEAESIGHYMRDLASGLSCPVYFVLGNHDYYKGSIADVRQEMAQLHGDIDSLHWLPAAKVIELTSNTALLGHGGWGDGQFGDFVNSTIMLNDYILIRELAAMRQGKLLNKLRALGEEAAVHVRATLPEAVANYDHIIFLTHVPPFREACVYEGKISDDNWLPHFSCKAVGDALREIMGAHPHCKLTVLCGHTHGSGSVNILPNLRVLTGGATYGEPAMQQPLLSVV